MKIKKLDMRGFSHDLALVLIVVVVAISGVGYLVASHADSSCPASGPATGPVTGVATPAIAVSGSTGNHRCLAWSQFVQINGPQTSNLAPSVVNTGNNTLAAFVTGTDRALYEKTFNGAAWLPFAQINGPNTSYQGPSVTTAGGSNLAAFVAGTDTALYEKTFNGSVWSPFVQISGPGSTAVAPSAISLGGNKLAVFFTKGNVGGVYEMTYNGRAWSTPQSITQFKITGIAPTAVALPGSNIALFLTATGGNPRPISEMDSSDNGRTWSTPHQISVNPSPAVNGNSAATITSPAVVSTGKGTMALFVTGQGDSALYEQTFDGTSWSPFSQINGPRTSYQSPAAVSLGGKQLAVFVSGTDGGLYEKVYR